MIEPEADITAQFEADMARLGNRVILRPQVRMRCWTHAGRVGADTLQIDFVGELEGRLLGFEMKRAPDRCAVLGGYLAQASQYAAGIIGANAADRVPQAWIGKPLVAVFVRTKMTDANQHLLDHARASHRLFGPLNVGFVVRERRGICLRLCAERFWTEWSGYHGAFENKLSRVGSGVFQA